MKKKSTQSARRDELVDDGKKVDGGELGKCTFITCAAGSSGALNHNTSAVASIRNMFFYEFIKIKQILPLTFLR